MTTPAAVTQTASLVHRHAAYCVSSQLRLSIGPRLSEESEQNTLLLEFRDISAAACDLRGYPGIALIDGSGARLAFTYRRRGDQMLTNLPPTVVRLSPGSVAYSAINKNTCVTLERSVAARVEATLPDGGKAVVLDLPQYPILGYCGAGQIGDVVDVTPVEPAIADIYARF